MSNLIPNRHRVQPLSLCVLDARRAVRRARRVYLQSEDFGVLRVKKSDVLASLPLARGNGSVRIHLMSIDDDASICLRSID